MRGTLTEVNRRLIVTSAQNSDNARVGWRFPVTAAVLACVAVMASGSCVTAQTRESIDIRGHRLKLIVSGPDDGQPVIVSSGDGGWIHLAPHVADVLSSQGFHVIGLDSRAYLEAFTTRDGGLSQDDVRADYEALTQYATGTRHLKPILLGVSEGAGLSVLAATGTRMRHMSSGVVALGMSNSNELAWRWKDAVIYLTHGVPNEPIFHLDALVGRVSPLPLAAVQSTNDEFSPVADVERILKGAGEPSKLWTIHASDHRFSDNLGEFDRRLLEAVGWVTAHAPR